MKLNIGWVATLLASTTILGCGAVDGIDESVAEDTEALTAQWSGSLSPFGISATAAMGTVTRGTGLLDLFTIWNNEVLFYRYDGTWHPFVALTAPSGVSFMDVDVANNNNRLEVVAIGTSSQGRKVYHNRSTTSGTGALTFGSWSVVSGNTPTVGPDRLALVCWGSNRLDAFWVNTSGKIAHAWGTNNLTEGNESGNTAANTYLQPILPSTALSLNAVSWGPGRIDIVLNGASGPGGLALQHHWYDLNAGGWGSGAGVHREALGIENPNQVAFLANPTNYAILSSGVGKFELYATSSDSPVLLYHTAFFNGWSSLSNNIVRFDGISTPNGTGDIATAAVYWNGGRRDIFGGFSGWQAYY